MRSSLRLCTFFGLFACFFGTRTFAATEPYWNWRNPLPQGNDYKDVAYGAGRFVAVGLAGTITTSTDGRTWSAANSGVNHHLSRIAYGNGRFVAKGYVSGASGLLISDDGLSWRAPAASLPSGWSSVTLVAYAGDRFFAMSNSAFEAKIGVHIVATSTDGVNWTQSPSATAAKVGRIAFGNGAYVGQDMMTGEMSSSDGITWTINEAKILRSADGVTWVAGGATGLATIEATPVYFDGRWLVGGRRITQTLDGKQKSNRALSSSRDGGTTWTVEWQEPDSWVSGGATLEGLAAFAGRLYLLGNPNLPILSTADLVTTREDVPARMIQLNSIVASADRVVAVGRYGQILSSGDGASWTSPTTSPVSGYLRAAAYGGGQWIVAGDAGLAASPDGIGWRMLPAGTPYNAGSIAYGNGRFVAGTINGHVGVSIDQGATWTDSGAVGVRGGLAFAQGRFVASSGLINSTDGVTWSTAVAPPGGTGYWTGIYTIDGVFYAVGTTDPKQEKDGVIARSVDGISWTVVASMSDRVASVGGKAGLLVASGYNLEVLTSTDGLTWKKADGRPLMSFGPAASVLWVGDSLVAVTFYGQVITSDDGVAWTKDEFASSGLMLAMAAGNGQVLAVGAGGMIWEVGAARFTHPPESRTVKAGDPVTFSVGVTGKEPLSYQWLKDGSPIGQSQSQPLSTSVRAFSVNGAQTRTLTISSAKPSDAGSYSVVVTNGFGSTRSGAAALVVGQAATPPRLTSQPESKAVTAGASVTFSVGSTGDDPLSYQWRKGKEAIVGATGSSYTIPAASASDNGSYAVVVSNHAGSVTSSGATLTVHTPPGITAQPESKTVNAGSAVTFSAVATGDTPLSYQWLKGNDPIEGATGSTYTILAPTASDSGTYTVVVRNGTGSVTSSGATLTVLAAQLVNLATRAYATTDNGVTIGGFVIAGSQPKQVLIRAVGPSLTTQGIGASEVLADPFVELHHGADTLATNDNWGDNLNAAAITSTAVQLGAAALDASDTKSAALLMTLDPGVYTFIAKGKNNTSGIVLLEVYDADFGRSSFSNIASRARCTTANGVTIGGFVITGNVAKQVLMRAVGPTLTKQGLGPSEVLADPTMELRHGSAILATNDNWGTNDNAAAIVNAGSRVGATPIDSSDTKSAALLMTLQPGVYSFIVSGKNDTSGLVLVEVYDAD